LSFKDIDLEISYISYGEDSISRKLLIPTLKEAVIYKRSVGFFSSSVFASLYQGVRTFLDKRGEIKIITSPKLSKEDIDVIRNSYRVKEKIIDKTVNDLTEALQDIDDEARIFLSTLILRDILNIKIVVTKNIGYYHDKFGILEDRDENKIVFVGSSNETITGMDINYEKVRVFTTWTSEIEARHVDDENKEFDSLWNNTNPHVDTFDFNEALKKVAFKIINEYNNGKNHEPYKWINNSYNGFYVMATGTGKTITALYSFKELIGKEDVLVIITVPYIHLISQWHEDVSIIYPDTEVIRVYSEDSKWNEKLEKLFIHNKYNPGNKKNLIIISTIKSFGTDKFESALKNYNGKRLLLVDEAHRFFNKTEANIDFSKYVYRLGLSATPVFGKNIEKTKKLLDFFGGKVYELTIDDAIGKFLVNYKYTPIYVSTTEEEESMFKKKTAQMASCFDINGKIIDLDRFIRVHKERLRILAMAENKNSMLENWLKEKKPSDHFIIYCGDGKVYDKENDGIRHLDKVKQILNDYKYRPTQFTAKESLEERLRIIKLFDNGEVSSIVAIKCLDEGINIPSIETAVILSSGDDYREFVQRRGRILRKHKDKSVAEIVDLILIPSVNSSDLAKIELRRFYEYSRLALNKNDLLIELDKMMIKYNINYEDIAFDEILESIDGDDIDD
jgi:superfamily II DNA or RNA helicase